MRKITYLLIAILLIFSLAACGSTDDGSNAESAESARTASDNSGSSSGETDTREISTELQLMLGTVLLDETEIPVDSSQASLLLPLWKVLNSLAASETTAQAEVDAVIASIQDVLTADQLDTIETMALSNADMNTVGEQLGIETGFGNRSGEMDPEMQAEMEARRESGEGRPEGMGPGGGSGGEEGITTEMRETAMAERSGALGGGFGINTQLLEAVIAFLEAKIQ